MKSEEDWVTVDYWAHWKVQDILATMTIFASIFIASIVAFSGAQSGPLIRVGVPLVLSFVLSMAWPLIEYQAHRHAPKAVRFNETAIFVRWGMSGKSPSEIDYESIASAEIEDHPKGGILFTLKDGLHVTLYPSLGYTSSFTQGVLKSWRARLEEMNLSLVLEEKKRLNRRYHVAQVAG